MQINSPNWGVVVFKIKVVPLPQKITTDFIFYQFFLKWSQNDAKEISFQGTSIKTYLKA